MKFTKKPVTVDAAQWHGLDTTPMEAVSAFRDPGTPRTGRCGHCGHTMRDHGWVDTLEGGHIVCPGDWIITGVRGETYPCKPDIFEATYLPGIPRPQPMEVFIDCEWNGPGGALISLALVTMDNQELYHAFPMNEQATPWVGANVIPRIVAADHVSILPLHRLPHAIAEFLAPYEAVHLIADWPEDIERFCRALIIGPGKRVATPPMTMEFRRDLDAEQSCLPHNALADARALKDHYLSLMSDV